MEAYATRAGGGACPGEGNDVVAAAAAAAVAATPAAGDCCCTDASGVAVADCKNEREVFIRNGGCGAVPSPMEEEVFWLTSDGRRMPKAGCDCEGEL